MRQLRRDYPQQDNGLSGAQDELLALVRLLAHQAAQEFVASSLTDTVEEDHDQTITPPARS